MKKRFSILIALVLVLAVALPVLASCVTDKIVKSIAVVSPKTEYKVNDTIDYDSLQVEVTYEDDTTAKKTVKELGATVVKADLSKAGNTSYTITYSGKSTTVNITVTAQPVDEVKNFKPVTFVEPVFYTNYKTKSADRGDKEETRANFRLTGETYEVGNANKFIYRPTATGLDLEKLETIEVENAKTTAKVYSKDAKNGTYAEVAADALADFVTIDNNTYKFSEQAAGKYVKLEISLDAEEYDVEGIEEENRTLTVEFVVVDGGYNVYDQMGLSAMCDIAKNAWADLWACQCSWDADKQTYVMSDKAGATALKLEADDQPLYKYVDNISCVILHASIELNADQMPAAYFWNSADDEGYTAAYQSLAGLSQMQARLIGSLNDGHNDDYYYRVLDMIPDSDMAADIKIGPNMQKALFLTKKVSVSGNYNSITVPEEESASGRVFQTVVDWGDDTVNTDPVPHYSIFQMYMVDDEIGHETQFEIKNLSMSGNSAKQNVSDEEAAKGLPAGMMMSLSYAKHLTYKNIVADKFFTNILVDGYGETGVNIESCKLYDSYSNMCYMWRSKINITDSEMIGSGGPLFILCDGNNHFTSDTTLTDANGSALAVDTKSVLQAYAEGGESWYKLYNAQTLIAQFKTMDKSLLNGLHKTILTEQNGQTYINIIAAIICSPSDLFKGNSQEMMDVCGSFTTKDGEEVVEQFAMHNQVLQVLRASVNNDARQFPIIFQLGDKFAFTDTTNLYTLGAQGAQPFEPATDGVAWATDVTHNKLGIYMSAGSLFNNPQSPYFGVIVEINPLAA